MAKYVIKASGQTEPFNIEKFRTSLKRSGATKSIIDKLAHEIQRKPELKTTQQIYYFALEQLKKENRPVAARYKIKEALRELGPSGFPFERFIAKLFEYQGFNTKVDIFLTGFCVDHEIDVLAEKKDKHYMFEVKFHSRATIKTDVKVTLYVQARYEDLKKKWDQDKGSKKKYYKPWVATNTKFTTEAIRYATCVHLDLLGWGYPAKDNIGHLVDRLGLHPITCLTSLNKKQKKELIQNGFVLCKDVDKHISNLKKLGLSDHKIQQVKNEAEGVCKL